MPIQKVVTLYRKHPASSPFEHHSKIILPFTIAEDITKGVGKTSEYKEIDVFPTFNRSYDSKRNQKKKSPNTKTNTNKDRRGIVITIAGHIDHGKTSLLDLLRKENPIAPHEAGLITQKIAVFNVHGLSKQHEVMTFIDTPGHATFTRMRENGCFVADIVVLVIAADEGIQSQTEECFEIIAEWKVPVIVAINKIDLPNINPELIKAQLKSHPRCPNHLIQSIVQISVKDNLNIDLLINSIDRIAESLQLEKEKEECAEATVINSTLSKREGRSLDVIVHKGEIHPQQYYVVGDSYSRVRSLYDNNELINKIPAGTYGKITGFHGKYLPISGDFLAVVNSRDRAVEITEYRLLHAEYQHFITNPPPRHKKTSLNSQIHTSNINEENNNDQITNMMIDDDADEGDNSASLPVYDPKMKRKEEEEEEDDVKVILKTDQSASLESLIDGMNALKRISEESPHLYYPINLVHVGVGNLNQNDLKHASISLADVYLFNTRLDETTSKIISSSYRGNLSRSASEVRSIYLPNSSLFCIKTYDIIYDLFHDVEMKMRRFPSDPSIYNPLLNQPLFASTPTSPSSSLSSSSS